MESDFERHKVCAPCFATRRGMPWHALGTPWLARMIVGTHEGHPCFAKCKVSVDTLHYAKYIEYGDRS